MTAGDACNRRVVFTRAETPGRRGRGGIRRRGAVTVFPGLAAPDVRRVRGDLLGRHQMIGDVTTVTLLLASSRESAMRRGSAMPAG